MSRVRIVRGVAKGLFRSPQTGRLVDARTLARTRVNASKMFKIQKNLSRLASRLGIK